MSALKARVVYLLRGHGDRRSRLHNERGELVSVSDLSRSLLHLRGGRGAESERLPWMVNSAIQFLHIAIRPTDRLLELGSGTSTAWYAGRAASVHSVEPDPEWAARTTELLQKVGATSATVEAGDPLAVVERLLAAGSKFEIVIVDSLDTEIYTRGDLLRLSTGLIEPGGFIVLDDADRTAYRSAIEDLVSWQQIRLQGIKAKPIVHTETLILRNVAGALALRPSH